MGYFALRTPPACRAAAQAWHSAWRKGQATVEYAVAIAVITAALLGMAIYTKRALTGRWRSVGDTFGFGRQYDPQATTVGP